MLTDGVKDILNYQGENKYTKIVRVLKVVKNKFNVVLEEFRGIESKV